MKTIRITRKDFDAAVSQNWSTRTCLLMQASNRLNLGLTGLNIAFKSPKASNLMSIFDSGFYCPGDEKKDESLKKLRASLPITIQLA